MEILVFVANGLYLLSYFVQDIIRLRLLTITATMCSAGYFYIRPDPDMLIVSWNLFFVILTMFQIGRALYLRRAASGGHADGAFTGTFGPFLAVSNLISRRRPA